MGEQVRAFVPAPLPPSDPPLAMRGPTVNSTPVLWPLSPALR